MNDTADSVLTVAVIGAGIVGSAIAYELLKRGLRVTLIDRGEPGGGCSAGNSGAISPSSVAPLAMPGLIASLPSMLLDRDGPLYLPPAYLPRAMPWLLRFVAAARRETVQSAATRLAGLHDGVVERHQSLVRELGAPELLLQQGHLHVYPDEASLAKDRLGWQLRAVYGHRMEALDLDGIRALEPRLPDRYRVGRFLPDQATIRNPLRYVQAIARGFVARGGALLNRDVRALYRQGDRWQIATESTGAGLSVDHVVVAAGVWSRVLLSPLGVRVPLESQRGYHVRFEGHQHLVSRTVVLADRKVFLTPMEDGLRVGGTVEIGGLSRPADPRRIATLERIARDTFGELGQAPAHSWMGHRPCVPDSIPIVGAALGHPGLWLAFGHGHLGLTQSLPTADRIASLVTRSIRIPSPA